MTAPHTPGAAAAEMDRILAEIARRRATNPNAPMSDLAMQALAEQTAREKRMPRLEVVK
jgi:hypothetical protein